MSLEVKGGVELRDDVARMADLLRASGGNGTRACNYILQTAAQPVLTRMLHNASTDPQRRSGTLYNSIRIGRVVKKRSGGYRVTVGVHRADGGAKYASPVEFGHGGPHPAPPHPFIRPAFDGGVDEAYFAVGFMSEKANGKYRYVWLFKVRAKPVTESYATKEGTTITRQTGEVEWTAIKRTSDGRYQAIADEGEGGFDSSKAATFLESVYTPTFTPEEDGP